MSTRKISAITKRTKVKEGRVSTCEETSCQATGSGISGDADGGPESSGA
jgi:hypothetical protein